MMLETKPWYFKKRFMYTTHWEPGFDITTGNYSKLLVWVDNPFHVLVVKANRYPIIKSLGPDLLYMQGDHHSSYPHDRACVLRDLNKATP